MNPALLVKVKRSFLTERTHTGFIILVDENERILSQIGQGDDLSFFLRSCAKPFQSLPIVTSGTCNKFNFSSEELAVCCGSHSASNTHLSVIGNLLNKLGLKEEDLKCGIHDPFDIETRDSLIRNSSKPSQLHNNCSGKHSGMLAVCTNNNWDIKNYLDFNHPLQLEILDIIKKYCNIDENITSSIDGCSAPIYGIPLFKMGAGYVRLFSSPEGELIKKAFIENPLLIGGKGRLDSLIMEISKGCLIAKTGAEGLCIVANLQERKSLVVKIMDSSSSARDMVVLECLKQLAWLSSEELKNEYITKMMNTDNKTLNNTIVGKLETIFTL